MKPYPYDAARHCILSLSLTLICLTGSYAQQFLTKINGWNAYVHLPDDYDKPANSAKRYPAIVFISGLEQVGKDPREMLRYGPSRFIALGHSMKFIVNRVEEKPIVISMQPPRAWSIPKVINAQIDAILRTWRVDPNRLSLTGISMGGWCWNKYVTDNRSYARRIASLVAMSSPPPDSISRFRLYAANGGKWWGFEGRYDYRRMDKIHATMNNTVKGTSRYTRYGAGHCCWNTFYDPRWKERGESVYTWMLKQRRNAGTYNEAPVAVAGPDTSITLPASSIVLRSRSFDPDGRISAFRWSNIKGPAGFRIRKPASETTEVDRLVEGEYTWVLQVADNKGAMDSDTVRTTVRPASPPPASPLVAFAGKDAVIKLPLDSLLLTGGVSGNHDNLPFTCTWSRIEGPSTVEIQHSDSLKTWVTHLQEGRYTFMLTVANTKGETDSDTLQVDVEAADIVNVPPVADAGPDQMQPLPAPTLLLDGTASYDSDGLITGYAWRQIVGAPLTLSGENTATLASTGFQPGTYEFELQVTDNDGAVGRDSVQITVTRAENRKPIADAGKDMAVYFPMTSARLDGRLSGDPDGDSLYAVWRQVEGPAQAGIADADQLLARAEDLIPGTYLFELSVRDTAGLMAIDSVLVHVLNKQVSEDPFEIFPNPSAGSVTVSFLTNGTGPLSLLVINASGTAVYRKEYFKQGTLFTEQINLPALPPGVYTVMIHLKNGKKLSRPFIRARNH